LLVSIGMNASIRIGATLINKVELRVGVEGKMRVCVEGKRACVRGCEEGGG
jgi:hypothetical protein